MGAKVKRDWCSECSNKKKNKMQHREIIISNNNTLRQDFTTMESYHGSNYFNFGYNDWEINSVNTTFMSQSNPPGMRVCMYVIGLSSALPDDDVLQHMLSQFYFFGDDPA